MKSIVSMLRIRNCAAAIALVSSLLLGASVSRAQGVEYTINKGDQLLVTVWGYSEFTTTGTVRDNGMFGISLIGDLKAAGLTKEEFISNLQKKLAEYIPGDIKITVSVLSSIGQRVTILGAVTTPGNYAVSSEVNLLELISMAAGSLPDARLNRIKIFHKDKLQPPTEVDLETYIEKSDVENMPKVLAGDIVFVPRQQNFVKEFGEFFRDVAFLFTLFRFTEAAR
ncbi:MAG: polysaccharide biosynthesis/export family protein [Bacteroidota bacterium]